MRKFFSNDYLTIVCRIVFGLIFIYASLDKISHPEQFARIVYNYHLLPGSMINFFALVLPFSEFIAGFLMIVGLFYRGSRNYLIFLMLVFLVAIAINLFRGISLECGCFTVSSKAKSESYQLIIRDLVYLLPGIILLLSDSKRWMMDNILFRKAH
jgi:uncharacterized membrane protein YphA (DoxX/SURF4 family)